VKHSYNHTHIFIDDGLHTERSVDQPEFEARRIWVE